PALEFRRSGRIAFAFHLGSLNAFAIRSRRALRLSLRTSYACAGKRTRSAVRLRRCAPHPVRARRTGRVNGTGSPCAVRGAAAPSNCVEVAMDKIVPSRCVPFALCVFAFALSLAMLWDGWIWRWLGVISGTLCLVGVVDLLATRHTLRRNFP